MTFPECLDFLMSYAMAKRSCVFVEGSRLRCCLLVWTFVAVLGIISGRQIDEAFRSPVAPKSPTTCVRRAEYCWSQRDLLPMMRICPKGSSCYPTQTDSLENNLGKKSKFSANLSATVFYRDPNHTHPSNRCIQVLNITWTVRLNDSDLPIDGFKLLINLFAPYINLNSSSEYVFFIKQGQMPVDKNGNTLFYFDCFRLRMATSYRVELLSLHSIADRVRRRLARSIGVLNLNTDCDVYPDGHLINSAYSGYINVSQLDRDCSITAYFTPAPDSYGFSGYNVQLLSNDKVVMKVENLPFKCNDYGPVSFKNVGPGAYQLKVFPVGRGCPCDVCEQCKSFHKNFNVFESNYVCQTVPTSANVISSHALDLTSRQPLESPLESGTSIITQSPVITKNQNVIIIVVALTVSAVVVLTGIMLLFKSRKCRGGMTVSAAASSNDDKDDYGVELTREPVVLIYASDNSYHNDVVRCLATYLQNYCHCDVRLDQWYQKDISEVSALDWILHQLKTVKNVIIINSEGAFRHYEADMRGVAYERTEHETPLENMFLPAMRELRSEYYLKAKSRKLFKITFPYTDSEFIINDFQRGITYRLMAHVEDLFLNIHGLSKHSRRGRTTVVDINQKDYSKSPEGQELEKAIRKASDYGKRHPDWFSRFYQEKPRKDWNKVCLSMNKDWNEGCPALQSDSSCLTPQSPVCDSGLGWSIEFQNVSDSLLGYDDDQQLEVFQAPDLDDVSSVSSANLELQGQMLNKDFDSVVGL